jgi:hypothetical protein
MSFRLVSASSVLDRLQAWGDPPVVNPLKRNERAQPAPAPAKHSRALFVGVVIFTLAALSAIVFAWLLNATPGTGFIYAQF